MPTYPIIQEIDVLVATTVFLVERGIKPYQFSTPRGNMKRIWEVLDSIGIRRIRSSKEGPDIIGMSETEWWQVECKGSGEGVQSTQRTNFDRALASAVSYYGEETQNLPDEYRKAQPYLGLALPASPEYLKQLKRRVRQPLRKRLNLWVLLYKPESKSIRAVSPEDSY